MAEWKLAVRMALRLAVLPLGGAVEYADQDPQGPLELRVYAGADGKFELYDDAGDSYAYERGERAVTPLT